MRARPIGRLVSSALPVTIEMEDALMSGQPEINGQAVVLLFFAPLPFHIFFGLMA